MRIKKKRKKEKEKERKGSCMFYNPPNKKPVAMPLAMLRPGKRYFGGKSWEDIEKLVWRKRDSDTYSFKKSHAYSYAMAIIVQLNKLVSLLD